MVFLKNLRVGFVICLALASMVVIIKLCDVSSKMETLRMIDMGSTVMNQRQKQPNASDNMSTIREASFGLNGDKNHNPMTDLSKKTESALPGRPAASPTKSNPVNKVPKPTAAAAQPATVQQNSKQAPAAKDGKQPKQAPAATNIVPIETSPQELKFLNNVKLFLQKLPANSSFSEDLKKVIDRSKSRAPGWEANERENLHDSQFLNYMKCPTSVRKKMLINKSLRERFIPEVPILAWNEHYTPEEYDRLKPYHRMYGWKYSEQKDVAETLEGINTLRNRYLFDDRMVNGSVPKDSKCIRCAVIGNGGILNGSKKGKEIDANDYVFRVNLALTKGHEEDVGTRTSFYCFGIVTLSNTLNYARKYRPQFKVPNDKGIRYVFFADSPWLYQYLAAVLNGKPVVRVARRHPLRFQKIKARDIKLVHPDFGRYIKTSWIRSRRQHRNIYNPTTGGIMLLLALHTCDEVNVYGFGGSYKKFSEHYYDEKFYRHTSFGNHDNTAENKLWKQLHDEGLINMYTRE